MLINHIIKNNRFLQDENKVNIRTIDYNEEKLILGIRNMKGGVPKIKNFSFSESDSSWRKEWNFFIHLINLPFFCIPQQILPFFVL